MFRIFCTLLVVFSNFYCSCMCMQHTYSSLSTATKLTILNASDIALNVQSNEKLRLYNNTLDSGYCTAKPWSEIACTLMLQDGYKMESSEEDIVISGNEEKVALKVYFANEALRIKQYDLNCKNGLYCKLYTGLLGGGVQYYLIISQDRNNLHYVTPNDSCDQIYSLVGEEENEKMVVSDSGDDDLL